MTRPRTPADAGFTMLEVMVTIGISGILMAIAVGGFQGWSRASAQEGLVTELQGVLRQAQVRAVTLGTSTCVDFDATAESWTVYRGACSSTTRTVVDRTRTVGTGLDIRSPRFVVTTSATSTGVTFSPRGTATPGSVSITRDGSDTVTVLTVEGLTGRVTTD